MANYVGYCLTNKVGTRHVARVRVPANGFHAGQVVLLEDLDTTNPSNLEVYAATQPATNNLSSKKFAIIDNSGFETLNDGRRPDGQPDFTQYTYKEGDIATAVFMDAHLKFEISVSNVTGATTANPSSDIGKYLIPANGTNALTLSETAGAGSSLKVVAVGNFANGGEFGLGFIPTYICIAE